jgi:glutathione S-transferase
MLKIHGVRLSPFVRKVWIVLTAKGIPFEANEISPFETGGEYREKLHPLGKIPCLEDGDFILPDSSAICNYLEGLQENPRFIPEDPKFRAKMLWFEEYADSECVRVFGGNIFFERWVKPIFLKQEPDEAKVQRAFTEDVPRIFSYLTRSLGENSFMVGSFMTLADIAIFSQVRNALLAGLEIDAEAWPELTAYFKRIQSQESVAKVLHDEAAFLKDMQSKNA